MRDEVLAEAFAAKEVAVRRLVLVVRRTQERRRAPVKTFHLDEHPQELPVDQTPGLREQTAHAPAAGVLETASVATHAHAHLGAPHLHAELGEQPAQQGIGDVVVHDETAVDRVPAAVDVGDVMRVRVTPESGLRLEQSDVVRVSEQVGGSQPGDTRPDHGDRRPVSRVGGMPAAHLSPLSSKVCLSLTLGTGSALVKSLCNVCRVMGWPVRTSALPGGSVS